MGKYYTNERLRELVEQYKPVGEPERPTEGMRTFLHGYAHAVEELTGIPGDNGKYLGEDGDVYLWLHPKSLEIFDAVSDDIDETFNAIKEENAKLRKFAKAAYLLAYVRCADCHYEVGSDDCKGCGMHVLGCALRDAGVEVDL